MLPWEGAQYSALLEGRRSSPPLVDGLACICEVAVLFRTAFTFLPVHWIQDVLSLADLTASPNSSTADSSCARRFKSGFSALVMLSGMTELFRCGKSSRRVRSNFDVS
jgi:hypothetical protein